MPQPSPSRGGGLSCPTGETHETHFKTHLAPGALGSGPTPKVLQLKSYREQTMNGFLEPAMNGFSSRLLNGVFEGL